MSVPPDLGLVSAVVGGNDHILVRCGAMVNSSALETTAMGSATCQQILAVAVGSCHTCAVRGDGQLVCLGDNSYGQCDVPADLGPVLAVAVGSCHTCAVRGDGQLVRFAYNGFRHCDVPTDLGPASGSRSRPRSYLCVAVQ